MKCPSCGKEIANDSLFCEYCGIEIVQDFEKSPLSQLKTKKCGNKKIIFFVASVALFHLSSFCVAYSVHYETFAYFGIAYDGYPGAGRYNGVFFVCVFMWLISLVVLSMLIHSCVKKK